MLKFLAAPAILSLAAFWACVPVGSLMAATEAHDKGGSDSAEVTPEIVPKTPAETAPQGIMGDAKKPKLAKKESKKKDGQPIKLYPAPLMNRP